MSGVTTRLRTAFDSVDDGGRLSLDRRSLVCVCAAARVKAASEKVSKSGTLFMLTLDSVGSGRFTSRAKVWESPFTLARKDREHFKSGKRRNGLVFRKMPVFLRVSWGYATTDKGLEINRPALGEGGVHWREIFLRCPRRVRARPSARGSLQAFARPA